MGWIEQRPQDVTSQILQYAETGRLLDGPRVERADQRGTIALVLVAALVLGAALGLAANGILSDSGGTVTVIAVLSALGAAGVLIPSVRLLRVAPAHRPIKVRPAAVLPPELVAVGNWIHRGGAWMRVEQIGRDGVGRINALMSSGDVIELTSPVTIAGDDFRPTSDPVAMLRH